MGRRFDQPAEELFEAMFKALGEHFNVRNGSPNGVELAEAITLPDLEWHTLRLLGRKDAAPSNNNKEALEDHAAFLGAFWRLVTLGYVLPSNDNAFLSGRQGMIITARGKLVLASQGDNPLVPDYLKRLRATHAMNSSDEGRDVIDRLEDSWACLEAQLYRPAIVMMGVSSEVTVGKACEVLQLPGRNAATKLEALRAHVQALPDRPPADAERKRLLAVAVDSMSILRELRNLAAHTSSFAIDRYDAHERYGSACRQLPRVWELLIIPNQPPIP